MFKVQFQIYHKTCWGSEIHTVFPQHELSSIDCRWVKGQVAHLLLARGNSNDFERIISYLKKRKDVVKVEEISRDDTSLYLRVLSRKDNTTKQFSDFFFEHDCFPIAPTRFEGKYEVWTLGTPDKKNISEIYTMLKKDHPTKMIFLKEDKMTDPLTKKQREILTYAKMFGYYEWPRKNSVTTICNIVKIPKTVFLSHLRKAENKVMKEYLKK